MCSIKPLIFSCVYSGVSQWLNTIWCDSKLNEEADIRTQTLKRFAKTVPLFSVNTFALENVTFHEKQFANEVNLLLFEQ